MQTLYLLIEKYVGFCSRSDSQLSRGRINEFQSILTNLTKIDGAPLKIKYGLYHITFLMECIAEGPGQNDLSFTGLIQILNIMLRQGPDFKIQAPNKLMSALNDHLLSSERFGDSPKVIANVIWLVGKCIQMGRDRTTLITCLSESKLIETCLQCSSYESSTARGITLLLVYMSKRQLLKKQFCLKLLHHLEKFTEKDAIREVLSLLRKIGIEKVKVQSSLMKKLGNILEKYFQQSQIKQFQKQQNWSLLVLVCHAHHDFIGKLGLAQVLAKVLGEPVIQISQEMLNKVNELLGLVLEVGTEEIFLRVAIENLFLNAVARSFFIQYHEKIGSQFFIEILSGNLPQIIAEKRSIEGEKDKVLKILICLKRTANLLGLDVFYEYKFKQVASEIVDGNKVGGLSGDLIDLWREVSEGNVRGGDVHHDFFH